MLNKEVMSLKGVVKSDSSVKQNGYFVRGLQRKSRTSVKGKLFESSICFKGGSMVYFVRREDCWEKFPHRLIKGVKSWVYKKYISISMRSFRKTKNKAIKAYV